MTVPVLEVARPSAATQMWKWLYCHDQSVRIKHLRHREVAPRTRRHLMREPRRPDDDLSNARRARILLSPFQLGDLTVDPVALSVEIDGHHEILTPAEWRLLMVLLLTPPGQAVTSEELAHGAWGDGDHRNAVLVYISRLRRKLERHRDGRPQLVMTVRGGGYRLAKTPVVGDTE